MGSTKLTKKELADRIGSPTKIARYELANKAEVKAFVDHRLEELSAAVEKTLDEEVSAERLIRHAEVQNALETIRRLEIALDGRICELELTRWQRFKRWYHLFTEEVKFAFTSDPSQFPMDDSPQTTFGVLGDTHENPYDRLARSLREMPTECAEDLAENPVVQEAIEQLGGAFVKVPPMHALETLPEFHDLPEYTAEEMPSLHDTQRTHDGELKYPVSFDGKDRHLSFCPGCGRAVRSDAAHHCQPLGDPNE